MKSKVKYPKKNAVKNLRRKLSERREALKPSQELIDLLSQPVTHRLGDDYNVGGVAMRVCLLNHAGQTGWLERLDKPGIAVARVDSTGKITIL